MNTSLVEIEELSTKPQFLPDVKSINTIREKS